MGREARVQQSVQEVIRRECEHHHVGKVTRFFISRPRLTRIIVTLTLPAYAIVGRMDDWRSDRTILSMMIPKANK